MILDYKVGDNIEWQHRVRLHEWDMPTGKWLPGRVLEVFHEDDDVGAYTTILVQVRGGYLRRLSEPEARLMLRHPKPS